MKILHTISGFIIFLSIICYILIFKLGILNVDKYDNNRPFYKSVTDTVIYNHPYRNPLEHDGKKLPAETTVLFLGHKNKRNIGYTEILHYDGNNFIRGYALNGENSKFPGKSPKWDNIAEQGKNKNQKLYDSIQAQFLEKTKSFVKSGSGNIEKNKVFPINKKVGHKKGFDASYYETDKKFYYVSRLNYFRYAYYLHKAKRDYKKNKIKYLYYYRLIDVIKGNY